MNLLILSALVLLAIVGSLVVIFSKGKIQRFKVGELWKLFFASVLFALGRDENLYGHGWSYMASKIGILTLACVLTIWFVIPAVRRWNTK